MLSIRQLFLFPFQSSSLPPLFVGLLLVRWLWFYPDELNIALKTQKNEILSLNSVLICNEKICRRLPWIMPIGMTPELQPGPDSNFFTDTTPPIPPFTSLKLSGVLDAQWHSVSRCLTLNVIKREALVSSDDGHLIQWLKEDNNAYLKSHPLTLFQNINNQPHLLAVSPGHAPWTVAARSKAG